MGNVCEPGSRGLRLFSYQMQEAANIMEKKLIIAVKSKY
jgi:hypothetical protein